MIKYSKKIEVKEDDYRGELLVRIYDVRFCIKSFLQYLFDKKIITGCSLKNETVEIDGEKNIDLYDFIGDLESKVYEPFYNRKKPKARVLWGYRKK